MNASSAPIDAAPATPEALIAHWQTLYVHGRYAEIVDQAHEDRLRSLLRDVRLLNLAAAAARADGRSELAEHWWRAALDIEPRNADLRYNLGELLHAEGRHADAEAEYRRALKLNAQHAAAWSNLAALLQQLGRTDESLAAYRRALTLAPDNAATHFNLGLLLRTQRRDAEALAALQRSIELAPGRHGAELERAALLRLCGRHDEAEQALRALLQARPDDAAALNELGALQFDLHRDAEAMSTLDEALQASPGHAHARWNQALLLLRQGRYAEGWPTAEARFDAALGPSAPRLPALSLPRWRPDESPAGHAILLCHEQGLGDLIQFCRYVPLLKQLGARRVGLSAPAALQPLLQSLPGLDAVHAVPIADDIAADYDCWEMTLSLPLHFAAEEAAIPASIPYLAADAARLAQWRERLGEDGGLRRIGLVWSGNPAHRNDRHRSLPGLQTLAPLWRARSDLRFYTVQPGIDIKRLPPGLPITDLGPAIRDFADTAAALSGLDLLISVDTATAHVAGALGLPCWLLLPWIATDWRWLDGRDDSPWYPTGMQLFRQPRSGDWQPVVDALVQALQAL